MVKGNVQIEGHNAIIQWLALNKSDDIKQIWRQMTASDKVRINPSYGLRRLYLEWSSAPQQCAATFPFRQRTNVSTGVAAAAAAPTHRTDLWLSDAIRENIRLKPNAHGSTLNDELRAISINIPTNASCSPGA